MKKFLSKYSDVAKIALFGLSAFLVTFGFVTSVSTQVLVGSALAFGVAFWKMYDYIVDTKKLDEVKLLDLAKYLAIALSSVLLAFGITYGSTIVTAISAVSVLVSFGWSFLGK